MYGEETVLNGDGVMFGLVKYNDENEGRTDIEVTIGLHGKLDLNTMVKMHEDLGMRIREAVSSDASKALANLLGLK